MEGIDKPKSTGRRTVGIDLGLKTFAVLSDGARFESQKPLRHGKRKLRRLNRTLARRKKGSKRWWDARNKLGRFHYRVACLRGDFTHKATTQIAESYDLIGIEDLNVAGMVRNRKLAFSISDASWSEFVRQLAYKCEQSGSTLVKVNRFSPSSRLCPKCGTINHALTLKDREWVCECGAVHDRDLNAACNIRDEAVRLN
jgi:putative transposase